MRLCWVTAQDPSCDSSLLRKKLKWDHSCQVTLRIILRPRKQTMTQSIPTSGFAVPATYSRLGGLSNPWDSVGFVGSILAIAADAGLLIIPTGTTGFTGPTGTTGSTGYTGPASIAYTNTTATFTTPAVGSSAQLTVANGNAIPNGAVIVIGGVPTAGGYYLVSQVVVPLTCSSLRILATQAMHRMAPTSFLRRKLPSQLSRVRRVQLAQPVLPARHSTLGLPALPATRDPRGRQEAQSILEPRVQLVLRAIPVPLALPEARSIPAHLGLPEPRDILDRP